MTRIVLWMESRPLWTLIGILVYLLLVILKGDYFSEIFAWIMKLVGKGAYPLLVAAAGVAGLSGAIRWWILRGSPGAHASLVRFYWIATLVILTIVYYFLFAVSSKGIHLLQYALLAMAIFALIGRTLDTLLWVTLIGAVDEGYQYWVLHRDWGIYFDFNDLVINCVGAAVGVLFLLGTVDLGKLTLPKRPRPVWRSPPFLLVTGIIVSSIVLYRMGRLALTPDSVIEPWVVISRIGLPDSFWHHEAWSRTFHVLRPLEAFVWVSLIAWFYSLLDHLIHPSTRSVTGYLDRLHAMLARVTRSTPYMASIDGMRFVAILAVVLYHMADLLPREATGGEWVRQLLGYGNIGVQFFFAISGFILAMPMLEDRLFGGERVSLGRYYLRRVTRIEPPYVICLILLVLLGLTTHPGPDQGRHLVASLFYVHGLYFGTFSTINFVAWSLEVEVQFYLLMPLVAWVFFRGERPWIRRVLLGALCVPFMLRQSIVHDHFPHGLFLIDQIQFFVAGIIVADIYVCGRRNPVDRKGAGQWWFDILGTLGFVLVPGIMHLNWQAARYVVPLGIGLWMYGALRGLLWRRVLGNRWIAVLGGMCYTVYLYHWLVLSEGLRIFGGFPFDSTWKNLLLIGPVLLVLTFLVSTLLYLAFERPFMSGFRGK